MAFGNVLLDKPLGYTLFSATFAWIAILGMKGERDE